MRRVLLLTSLAAATVLCCGSPYAPTDPVGRVDDAGGGAVDAATDSGGDDASPSDAGCDHTFCDDFNRTGPVETGWSSRIENGGTLAIVTNAAVSPPSSLDTVVQPIDGGGAQVFLEKQFTTPAQNRVHVEWSMALENQTPKAEVDLVQLKWLSPGTSCTTLGYFIVRDSTGPVIMQETYAGCAGNVNTPLPNAGGGFHRYVMDVTLGATGHVKLQVDTTTVFDKDVLELPASGVSLRIGAPGIRDVTAPWHVRFDDLVVDVE